MAGAARIIGLEISQAQGSHFREPKFVLSVRVLKDHISFCLSYDAHFHRIDLSSETDIHFYTQTAPFNLVVVAGLV